MISWFEQKLIISLYLLQLSVVFLLLSCNVETRSTWQRLSCSILPSCFILIRTIPNIGSNIHIRSLFLLIRKRHVLPTLDLSRSSHIADVYSPFCILRCKSGKYDLNFVFQKHHCSNFHCNVAIKNLWIFPFYL